MTGTARGPEWREKGGFGRVARPAKRHYTFAPRRPVQIGRPATNTANHAHKALIFQLFCSLRLSVRTPPFHGGESGSIPLGSAKASGSTSPYWRLLPASRISKRPTKTSRPAPAPDAVSIGRKCQMFGLRSQAAPKSPCYKTIVFCG